MDPEKGDTSMESPTDQEFVNSDFQQDRIPRLPAEVLRHIFQYLPCHSRKYVRLTCKLFYTECDQNEFMYIKCKENTKVEHQYLENCNLRNLRIYFKRVDLESIPKSTWKNLGPRIHTLSLRDCVLGNQSLKNIILFCVNMQSLQIHYKNRNLDKISGAEIGALNVKREKVDTFYFTARYRKERPQGYDCDTWADVFKALCHTFPNIVHFGSLHMISRLIDGASFRITLKEPNPNQELLLAVMLALSLGDHKKYAEKLMILLSKIRFTAIALNYVVFLQLTQEDRDAALGIFTGDRSDLKSVDLRMDCVSQSAGENLEKDVFFRVLENCPQLHTFKYFSENSFMKNLSKSERSRAVAKMSNIKELKVEACFLSENASRLQIDTSFLNKDSYPLAGVHSFENVRHLILTSSFEDDTLQFVFKLMTNLNTLRMRIRNRITNFGMIGYCEKKKKKTGVSIRTLRNLETLSIDTYESYYSQHVTDMVFDEFDFPKLRYLDCFTPKKHSLLPTLVDRLPLLEEMKLSWSHSIPHSMVQDMCRRTKNLRILHLEQFYVDGIDLIFEVCPTLQFLHTYIGTFCYETSWSTTRVVFKHMKTLASALRILRSESAIDETEDSPYTCFRRNDPPTTGTRHRRMSHLLFMSYPFRSPLGW